MPVDDGIIKALIKQDPFLTISGIGAEIVAIIRQHLDDYIWFQTTNMGFILVFVRIYKDG